jgi:chromosome segregation ATPase
MSTQTPDAITETQAAERRTDFTRRLGAEAAKRLLARIGVKENLLRQRHAEIGLRNTELEREYSEAVALQDRLLSLQSEVDTIADKSVQAEAQLQSFKAQLAELREFILDGWAHPQLPEGPNYIQIARLQAAVDDFPRVKAYLAAKLEVAERALAEFEQTLK